jgi:hypothetical protein
MACEIITMEDLQQFRLQLLADLKVLVRQQNQTTRQWLKSAEVRKMLGISHGTLQNLRIKSILPYKKIGSIMYYKYDDILKILENGADT